METIVPTLDAKLLYRKLDSLFGGLEPNSSQEEILKSFFDQSFRTLQEGLRLRAALYYQERSDGFELMRIAGNPGGAVAENLDATTPSLQLLFKHLVYIYANPEAEEAPFHQGILPRGAAAAIFVGKRPKRSILFFLLDSGWVREELDFALNTVRAALSTRMVEEQLRGSFKEAAEIQQSLLLEDPPEFAGYDIACNSIPTEEVGGDFFDFVSFDDQLLGLSIGDASGHGLPAALLVRDVVTGLRMGVEKNLKAAYVFEKLNKVIHRSRLSSRFVSVFYGELESSGNLLYVNAGHQPPLIFNRHGVVSLDKGGSVIGPLPEARFQRGFAHIERDGVLAMCTDGILERRNSHGEFFDEEGLKRVIHENRGARAQEVLDRLFAAAHDHGSGRPWEDDATAVIVIRK
jgi:sigma-B regulation protein RsbU (phosphoserine phosphatase)